MINFDNQLLNIVKIYRDSVIEAEMQVKNAAYEALVKTAKYDVFFIKENLSAKDKEIDKRFGPELKWSYQKKEDIDND